MIICGISFTSRGKELEKKLEKSLLEITWAFKKDENLMEWTQSAFSRHLPLVFIGAAGIAVRTISPFVNDKFTDSPVLVIDEDGKFVIPILSGHLGGANELASQLAERIGAQPVITTATDLENIFSIDNFARKNGFTVENREGIKNTAKALMSGKKLGIWISPEIKISDENMPQCLVRLSPRRFCIGIGCKKGTSFEKLQAFIKEKLPSQVLESIFCFSSIDLKKDEEGLMTLAQYYHVPLKTFSADQLEAIPEPEEGFSSSAFVKEVTGVSNVCERSAVACAGEGARLIIKKIAANGMTLAVAERIPQITSWETRN